MAYVRGQLYYWTCSGGVPVTIGYLAGPPSNYDRYGYMKSGWRAPKP